MTDAHSPPKAFSSPPPPPMRNPGLDYLRSIAIVLVLANHCYLGFFLFYQKAHWSGWLAVVSSQSIIAIEWLFVLSGYLIGTMMIRSFEKDGSWISRSRDFWLRRWFRTLPCYYLFLLINIWLVNAGMGEGRFDWSFVFFCQNLIWPDRSGFFFSESWSLALDEWFYFVMPLILGIILFALRPPLKIAFIATSALLILAPTLMRFIHFVPDSFFSWDAHIRRTTIYHLDPTGWGVLAASVNRWFAAWWYKSPNRKALLGLACTAGGMACVAWLTSRGWRPGVSGTLMNTFSLSLTGAGTFLIFPWLTRLNFRPPAFIQLLGNRLSLYSYTIYLSHFPAIFIFRRFSPMDISNSMVEFCFYILVWLGFVLAVSALVFHSFEKPVSDLRNRFTRRISTIPF